MRAFLLVTFLSACNSGGSVGIGGDTDTDADTDTDTDTERDTEPEPTVEDYVGDWVGPLEMAFESRFLRDCEGELRLDVDPDGEVEGPGSCNTRGQDLTLWFAGVIQDDGSVEGVLSTQLTGQPANIDVVGRVEGETFVGEYDQVVVVGEGRFAYEVGISGRFDLVPEE